MILAHIGRPSSYCLLVSRPVFEQGLFMSALCHLRSTQSVLWWTDVCTMGGLVASLVSTHWMLAVAQVWLYFQTLPRVCVCVCVCVFSLLYKSDAAD